MAMGERMIIREYNRNVPAAFRNGDTVRFFGLVEAARRWGSPVRIRLIPRLSAKNQAIMSECGDRTGRVFCTYPNGDLGVLEFNGHQWRVTVGA